MNRIDKVLIIEDDRQIIDIVALAIRMRWPKVETISADLGERGIELAAREKPDVIILDLGLPDISGYEVLKEIRLFFSDPILILSVQGNEGDIVKGLEWGADDYLVKPFRRLELLSRIEAITRRRGAFVKNTTLVCGQLQFDFSSGHLRNGEKEIPLTPTENIILHQLMKNAGRVVTHSSLMESVWGEDCPYDVNTLRVYIRHLREKIETDPGRPQLILTKNGIGYSFVKPVDIPS